MCIRDRFRGRRSRNKVTVGEPAVGSLIAGVFFFGSGWLGFFCNVVGLRAVSLGERVWCLAGTLLVACLEVTLVFFVCACKPCLCLSHPSFVFLPPMCFCGGFGSLFLGSPSDELFGRAWLLRLRCSGNTMDKKFRLIRSGGARSFVRWKEWAKGAGFHSWFSRKGGGG